MYAGDLERKSKYLETMLRRHKNANVWVHVVASPVSPEDGW